MHLVRAFPNCFFTLIVWCRNCFHWYSFYMFGRLRLHSLFRWRLAARCLDPFAVFTDSHSNSSTSSSSTNTSDSTANCDLKSAANCNLKSGTNSNNFLSSSAKDPSEAANTDCCNDNNANLAVCVDFNSNLNSRSCQVKKRKGSNRQSSKSVLALLCTVMALLVTFIALCELIVN